jgi:hypothetical protein
MGVITAGGGGCRGQRWQCPAGLRTPGTEGHVWLAGSFLGHLGVGWRRGLQQGAGQRVEQEMAGAEVGRGEPDAPAGDELKCGGRCGPRARRTWIWHVPESRSCSIGPRSRLSPKRSSPPCPVRCPRSRAATHVWNGTSTIRRNDPGPSAEAMPSLMLAPRSRQGHRASVSPAPGHWSGHALQPRPGDASAQTCPQPPVPPSFSVFG